MPPSPELPARRPPEGSVAKPPGYDRRNEVAQVFCCFLWGGWRGLGFRVCGFVGLGFRVELSFVVSCGVFTMFGSL